MAKFRYLAKSKISQLPETPGVYAFLARRSPKGEGGKKGAKLLYIGKAVNLRDRVKQHKLDSVEFKVEFKLDRVEYVAYIETGSEDAALLLEAKLIKKYRPKYNVMWRDDKNYFYVGITKEPFPRVFITHQPLNNGGRTSIIGPFVKGKSLKQALKDLRKEFPYRTCKALPRKPCLWYHLNQCPAPCLSAVALAKEGLFKNRRIEAYDISNIRGKEATGSMITFINGKPDKNFYRRFKIKKGNKPNDTGMLKEVLSRRLRHSEWPYPDLIIVDGGKAQLNAAALVAKPYTLKTKIMALAKKNNELFVEGQKKPILLKSLPQEFSNLILRARDEAHRFARKYHHHLRKVDLLSSS